MGQAPGSHPTGRRDNGLQASSYVPLTEVDTALGTALLTALSRARIAAYLEPLSDPARGLLYAAGADRTDARTIVVAVTRAWASGADPTTPSRAETETPLTPSRPGDPHDSQTRDSQTRDSRSAEGPGDANPPGPSSTAALASPPDTLAGRDTEAEFSALVADWHVDTVAAIRSAERDLNREDADWRARFSPPPADADADADDEQDHFVPPPPPPLPRLSATTIWALILVGASLLMILAGTRLGLDSDTTFMLGIAGILGGAGVFVMKLRAQPEEDDDDGAIL